MNSHDPATTEQSAPTRLRRVLSTRGSRSITAGAVLMCAAIGIAACGSASGTTASPSPTAAGSGVAGAGSNARSGPAAGGASGTVNNVTSSTFTMSTLAGQEVTVSEAPSTTYQKDSSSASANAITTGEAVLVLGTTSGTTIAATQVIVQPIALGSAASAAAGVVPFTRGSATTSKEVGQIPADYSQGSGTIVSGTTANKATEAALAAYPGGIVDRVVQLSGGEFEVHYIGVNWPHHVFVNQDFEVVGAN